MQNEVALAQRHRAPAVQSKNPSDTLTYIREFLAFKLGKEEYGIDILKVQEIRGYEAATRMVSAPAYVLGVLNLRGVIVPILDMRIKFHMDHVAYDTQTVTIVLTVANRVVGMVVDAVSDVVALNGEQIKPAPEFGSEVAAQHIIGIANIEQEQGPRMLILLDIEKLMGSAEMGLMASIESPEGDAG